MWVCMCEGMCECGFVCVKGCVSVSVGLCMYDSPQILMNF